MNTYRTSEIAALTGVHPNTVRRYEEWGFLPPIKRASNGYRIYSALNLEQMRLARLAMRISWMGGEIRRVAYQVIYRSADGVFIDAYKNARLLQEMIDNEQHHASIAVSVLEEWVEGFVVKDSQMIPLSVGQAARHLSITADTLRYWERNGLIQVPRNPLNGYRQYGIPEMNRLSVIRTLRKARYSTMAILRMMLAFEKGQTESLVKVLDTPDQEEDMVYVTDQWLTTLADMNQVMEDMIKLLSRLVVDQAQCS